MFNKFYFGTSVLDLDLAAEISGEQHKLMGFVESTGRLDIWYLPVGEFLISDSLPGLRINYQRQNSCGQVLLRSKSSDTFWHATLINHYALYRTTRELLGKENEILLYLSRRMPLTDFEQIKEAVARLRSSLNLHPPEPMAKQFAGIMQKLPLLCDRCEQESKKLRSVPDEERGVCPACLEQYYRICWDCKKPVPLEEVKFDGEDALCATCLQWGKGMGFR